MALRTISAGAGIGCVRQAAPAQSRCQVLKRPFFGAARLVNRAGSVAGRPSATLQQVLELAQEIDAKTSTEDVEHWDGGGFEDEDDEPGMTASEVKKVLKVMCSETEVAQIDLKSGSFELRVTRLGTTSAPTDVFATMDAYGQPAASASFSSQSSFELPAGFRMPTENTLPTSTTLSTVDYEEDGDEEEEVATELLISKKVGFFYRARTSKKRPNSKPLVAEGDVIKVGQVVGFLEQVGQMTPVKATDAGEVVAFHTANGQSVQFGQPILEVIPR